MECKSIVQSSSSSRMTWKHDVFVSFRGEDTRNNFTDHLFGAFKRKGIVAFRDDITLKKGGFISTELVQAIQGSQVLIVVFSKNYAASTWCLEELANIVDRIKVTEQSVLPVFYDVNPSEVRKQSGDYGKALAEHEERFKEDFKMVQRWREALVQVASLSGWDVQNKPQYGEIEKIVEKVTSILGYKFSSLSDDLVGMHSRVEQLEKLLVLDSDDDVRVVGICGMGGIGKTTLARALYGRIYHRYGACCFIDDVSKIYGSYGSIGVQKQLLCQTLNEENQEIWDLSKATYLIRTRLRHTKTLIVLDNVDKGEQLEKLVVNPECLCAGSRILIVSRDEHILREYGVHAVYNVQLLNRDNALQLFCKKAFKCDNIMSCDDIIREYEVWTNCALEYAQGLPLAIKVLGSFLYGRDISEWRSTLARLRDNPKKEIMDVLQISFDGLEPTEKEIFLDIACLFDWDWEVYVKRVLECCGFHPDIGIRVLIDKSLITIRKWHIEMHDKLRELGRKIVQEKAPNEPGKWSRLWLQEDFHNVMYEKMALDNLEAIKLQSPEGIAETTTTLRAEALSKMSYLRLLILNNVNFSGSLNCLSNQLRYLEWDKYPFTYFPSNCELTKLVELVLPYSNIKQLWEGIKPLYNLRVMDLHHSKNLVKTPDFRGVPNLERLNLEECTKLVQINPSIGFLRKLVDLNLKNCTSLMSLPYNIFGLSSLGVLNLCGCSKLFNNQLLEKARHGEHLKKLDLSDTAIQCQSTSSIYKRLMLPFHFFNSRSHKDTVGLLMPSLSRFACLADLDLSFCNLLKIPDTIVLLHGLKRLNLGGNNFVTLPCSSIKELPRLRSLNLQHCKQLTSLSEFPVHTVFPVRGEHWGGVAELCIFDCPKLVEMESWSSVALAWMIQVLQIHKESPLDITIVIPGTQIPNWFNNQTVDSSIRIKPIPNIVHDSNWIGVAFCVAFVLHDDPTKLENLEGELMFACHLMYKDVGCIINRIPVTIKKDLVTVEWAHLCLTFFTREVFIELLRQETEDIHDLDGFKVGVISPLPAPQGLRLEVKNCGMRLVFKQDLEELNLTVADNDSQIGKEPSHREIGVPSTSHCLCNDHFKGM